PLRHQHLAPLSQPARAPRALLIPARAPLLRRPLDQVGEALQEERRLGIHPRRLPLLARHGAAARAVVRDPPAGVRRPGARGRDPARRILLSADRRSDGRSSIPSQPALRGSVKIGARCFAPLILLAFLAPESRAGAIEQFSCAVTSISPPARHLDVSCRMSPREDVEIVFRDSFAGVTGLSARILSLE